MSLAEESMTDDVATPAARGFLPILWQRKALVILGALLGLAGGFLFYWQKAPVYQSTAQLLVIKKRSDALPVAGGDPRLNYVDDYMATHLVLLKSPLIIERAIKRRELTALKTFENSGDPVGQVLGGLTATRDAKDVAGANNVVHLSFRGPVAEECGKVLTAIIESYQEFLDITYRNVSDQTLDLITKARDVIKKDLAESEKKYLEFRQQTPQIWKSKDGVSLQMERVATVEARCSALLLRQTELQERIKFLDKAVKDGKGADGLAALSRSGTETKAAQADRSIEDQLVPLMLQEMQLLERYADDHPDVKSVRAKQAFLREHFRKSNSIYLEDSKKEPAQRLLDILREELRETDMVKKSLVLVLDGLKADAKDLSTYEIQEEHLRKDAARLNQLYEGTIKRLQEINLVRDTGGFDARTLAQSANGVKVAPSSLQMILGGCMLGLLLGIGLAFLADVSDKSFRNPDEVRRRLGLHVLGHIPFLKADAELLQRHEAKELGLDPLLIAWHRPKSLEAEAYRAVRTSLFFSTQEENRRVLQVSSPSKGDGKSLMVSNLAISMAQSGKKVLVIDADCRRPRQHKIFELPNELGLASVIGEGVAWKDVTRATAIPGLSIMPSGPIPHNPSELLTAPAFDELLRAARGEFDFVLVDTPPLLAVTDPCVVASRVDGLLLIIRLSRQGRPHAERAREILKTLGVKIIGVVVNGVARQGSAGIYNAEHYDYTESYTEPDNASHEDGYYYAEEAKVGS